MILVADACVFRVANYPHDLAQAGRLMIQICSPETTIKRNKRTLHAGSLSHDPDVLCDPWLFLTETILGRCLGPDSQGKFLA